MAVSLAALWGPLQRPAGALVALGSSVDRSTAVTSTLRTYSEQAMLYRQYLNGQSSYPAAKPGTSKHEKGLAFDLHASPATLAYLGGVWNSWGGHWSPTDPIHFETR